jgi:hypothetical protein
MPAWPGDDTGTRADQVFTMINQQSQFTLDAIEARDGQITLRSAARATASASIVSDLP